VEIENEALRKRNARLERRLQQAETIIEIQKKVSEILGIPLTRIGDSEGDN
jgi:cell shape-determining protein MreC